MSLPRPPRWFPGSLVRFPRLIPCLAVSLSLHAGSPQSPDPGTAPAVEELLSRLRAAGPERPLTNEAVFHVRPARPQPPFRVPFVLSVFPTSAGWCALYELQSANGHPALRLWIERSEHQPPRFFLAESSANDQWAERRELTDPSQRMQGLAGSDFAPADLGMEFLFWPQQRLVRSEMRRGQFCDVLESCRPDPPSPGYTRVRAWFDRDTGGLVYAEAWDAQGRLLKEFLPRRFRKIDGRWEVTELEMIHRQTGSRTLLSLRDPGSGPGR